MVCEAARLSRAQTQAIIEYREEFILCSALVSQVWRPFFNESSVCKSLISLQAGTQSCQPLGRATLYIILTVHR